MFSCKFREISKFWEFSKNTFAAVSDLLISIREKGKIDVYEKFSF